MKRMKKSYAKNMLWMSMNDFTFKFSKSSLFTKFVFFYSAKMTLSLCFLVLNLSIIACQEECPVNCIQPEPNRRSIVVRGTGPQSRLGNKMSIYAGLLSLKKFFDLQVFAMKSELDHLQVYFDNLEIEAAEDRVCNFAEDYQNYDRMIWKEREKRVLSLLRNITKDESFDFEYENDGHKKLKVPSEHFPAYSKFVNSA